MSQHCSRKSFFAKLGGLIAAAGLLPKVFAKTEAGAVAPSAPALAVRTDARAVARKEGSL